MAKVIMKNLLTALLLFVAFAATGQNWTAALPHVTSITGVPSASGSWLRLNTTNGRLYQYNPNTLSFSVVARGFDILVPGSAPNYTPSYNQSEFVSVKIGNGDSLYQYRDGAWRHLNPGSSGGGATYTAGTGIAISGGNVISNTGDLSTTNEIQRFDTLSLSGNTLSASLLNDGVPASTVDLSSLTPSTEAIQDIAGGMVSGNTETRISLTYDDAGGKINAVVDGNLSSYTNDAGFLTAEVDGSVSNEGSLSVGAGGSTTSAIVSNTSGSTSVTISASTGLSISEAGSTITLTNSAPDQTVSITGAGINNVTGTYPSFTVTGIEVDGSTTNELQNLSLTGQSLSISGGTGATLPVVGATASDFDLASGVLSLDYTNAQKATALVPGLLSETDWAIFNGKQSAGNYITALTGDVTASGPGSASATVTKINGTSLAALGTGILKNTTTTGVPSIAVAGDFPTLNQNTTGSAATITTPRAIYGNNFDGSADLTQIIAANFGGTGNGTYAVGDILQASASTTLSRLASVATGNVLISGGVTTVSSWGKVGLTTHVSGILPGANGGTNNAFMSFTGPSSGARVFTLPNANATILTSNTAVTVAQGGTGRATSTTAYGLIAAGTTATGAHQTLAAGATTAILVGGGASALPQWTTATGSGSPVRATAPTVENATVNGATVASVGSGNGTAAANAITVTGATGGATSAGSGTVTGGVGGGIVGTGGNGGAITGAPATGFGGAGGQVTLTAGDGGTGTTFGGAGGNANIQAGNGGNGTTPGAGGYAALKAGNGSSAGNSSGGNVFLVGGAKTGSGLDGDLYFGVSPSFTSRGKVKIGGSTAPSALLTIGEEGSKSGTISLAGSTSGTVTVQPAAAAGTYTLTLPTTDGAADEFLKTDGSGVLSWAGPGYKIYIANITQSGTADPVATVLENTLGVTPTWARLGTGQYTVTATGIWVTNKTTLPDSRVFIGGEDQDEIAATLWVRISADVLKMRIIKPSLASESNIDMNTTEEGFTVTIKVYN